MNSMTGFGDGVATSPTLSLRVELSSVNRKNLDIQISLPRPYAALEARCQAMLQAALHRGRIQVKVSLESQTAPGSWGLDTQRAAEMLREANRFAAEHGLEPLRSVAEFVRTPQLWRENAAVEAGSDEVWPLLESAMSSALESLRAMRLREGEHLRVVLAGILDGLEAVAAELEPLVDAAKVELEEKLRGSVAKLGTLSAEMEARLLQEIALHGEKSDVREEIDRIRGHVAQCRDKLGAGEAVGRALDFLCQELAREFNTLSVKASRADINRLALAGKERVEMFREQVQNVE